MATSKKSAAAVSETPAVKVPTVKKAPAAKKIVSKPAAVKPSPAPKTELKGPAKVAAKAPVKTAVKAAAKTVAKVPAKKTPQTTPVVHGPSVDVAQRANYIEVAAYYIAQRRGFLPGDTQQDYLDAAAEIDQLIAAGHFSK